jgi:hypothetical protein
MIFPSGFGQRSGTFTPVRMEFVAGRETLVVEWRREADALVDRFWIDTQTNILLRWQNFGKTGRRPVDERHHPDGGGDQSGAE